MDSVSQESNMKLIKEIKKRPCLYNNTLVNYNRKSVQNKAWEEVGQIMGWNAGLCRERWRNLRCVYMRHVRSLSQGVSIRPYYLMDAMRFALPFFKPINDKPLPMELLEGKIEDSEENNDEDGQQLLLQKSLSPSHYKKSRSASPEPSQSFMTTFSCSQIKNEDISQSSDLSLTRHSNSGTLDDILRTASTNTVHVDELGMPPNLELQDDAKKMFLLSLLPDVYAMSDVQMRTFKRGVLNLIGEIFDCGNSTMS